MMYQEIRSQRVMIQRSILHRVYLYCLLGILYCVCLVPFTPKSHTLEVRKSDKKLFNILCLKDILRPHVEGGELRGLEMFARNLLPGWTSWGNEVRDDMLYCGGLSVFVYF